jgi:hypothetical protein
LTASRQQSAIALRMRSAPRTLWLLGIVACGSPAARSAPRTTDKAALFADPTLVPTRDGEAARRELAESGEITKAIRATSWIDDAHVDVEHAGERTRVLVGGMRTSSAPDDLDARVRDIVRAVCGDDIDLVLAIADAPTTPQRRRLDLPLGLALVGLGASIAVLADRGWRRRLAKRRAGARART